MVDLGTPRNEISEPLGIETLTPYVEAAVPGTRVDFRSLELDNYSDVDEYLRSGDYDVIGLSTKIRSYDKFSSSVETIKKASPQTVVVVGDILGTYAFEDVLDTYEDVICVRGEGEIPFTKLVNSVAVGQLSLSGIPNLAYKSNGKLVTTDRVTMDLRKARHPNRVLAPEILRQNGCARVEGSRGCAYSLCSYCGTVEKYNGPGWRPFDIDFVTDELTTISDLGFKSPWFTDEDFFGDDIQRVYDFADAVIDLKKQGMIRPDLDFYINARADSILGVDFGGTDESRKVLLRLKEAGLREVFLGLESGCKRQLKRYRKAWVGNKSLQALNHLRGLGIGIDIGFIFFDKDATIQDLRDNTNFVYDAAINTHDARLIKRVRIEPRTPMGDDFKIDNPHPVIDMDLVEFEYEFTIPEVGEAFMVFQDWEKGDLDVIYNLQALCRGEVPEDYTREEVKVIISRYRHLDWKYFNEVLSIFETGEKDREVKIGEITQRFERERDNLDNTSIDRVKWLDSTFRRNL